MELYHLHNDPFEQQDLSNENKEMAKSLEYELTQFLDTTHAATQRRTIENAFYRLKAELGKE